MLHFHRCLLRVLNVARCDVHGRRRRNIARSRLDSSDACASRRFSDKLVCNRAAIGLPSTKKQNSVQSIQVVHKQSFIKFPCGSRSREIARGPASGTQRRPPLSPALPPSLPPSCPATGEPSGSLQHAAHQQRHPMAPPGHACRRSPGSSSCSSCSCSRGHHARLQWRCYPLRGSCSSCCSCGPFAAVAQTDPRPPARTPPPNPRPRPPRSPWAPLPPLAPCPHPGSQSLPSPSRSRCPRHSRRDPPAACAANPCLCPCSLLHTAESPGHWLPWCLRCWRWMPSPGGACLPAA